MILSGPGDELAEHFCKVCLINRGVTGDISNSSVISWRYEPGLEAHCK